jgi:hypothetical protein
VRSRSINTLADLTVRIPPPAPPVDRHSRPGSDGRRRIEAFFATYPQLKGRTRSLIGDAGHRHWIVPWEQLRSVHEVNASQGFVLSCGPSACNSALCRIAAAIVNQPRIDPEHDMSSGKLR